MTQATAIRPGPEFANSDRSRGSTGIALPATQRDVKQQADDWYAAMPLLVLPRLRNATLHPL